MFLLFLLVLPGVRTQEVTTPSSLLGPREYNYRHFNAVQFVKPKPTKKGPILFPNDAPPPPPTPLIVTSRPLSESIARSELNPNNSLTAQSQLNQVSYRPEYLARVKDYKPFAYTVATVTPIYDYASTQNPHVDIVKNDNGIREDHFYSDYEKRLMAVIHRRRHEEYNKAKYLWDQPVHRRRTEQRIPKQRMYNNARKSYFYDDDRSTALKVWHRSLYSRETNDNTFSGQNNRRINFDKSGRRYREPDYRRHHQNNNNNRHSMKRTDSHSLGDDYDIKNENKHLFSRQKLINNNNRNKKWEPRHREGTLSDEDDDNRQNKHHLPLIENLSDLNKRKKWRLKYDENLNVNDWHRKIGSPHSIENQSNNNDRKTRWRFKNRTENITDNNDIKIKNTNSHSVENHGNAYERNTRWRILNRTENLIDDNDIQIKNKHTYSIENFSNNNERDRKFIHRDRAENINENYDPNIRNKHSHSLEFLSDSYYDTIRRKQHSNNIEDMNDEIEILSTNYGIKVKRNQSDGIKDYGDNNEKYSHRRPVFKSGVYSRDRRNHKQYIEEKYNIQQRNVRPLSPHNALPDYHHGHKDPTTNQHPYRYNPQANSPDYSNYYNADEHRHDASNHGENYAFSYKVKDHKTGDDFSHSQQSTGSATNGEYRVRLPDGRTQIVSYTADENGYKADVRYDDQHNLDNSINVDTIDDRYRSVSPFNYKSQYQTKHDHLDSRDFSNNPDYLEHNYKDDKSKRYYNEYQKIRPSAIQDFQHRHDSVLVNNEGNVGVTKNDFLSDSNNDYLEHYKEKNVESNDKFDDVNYTEKPAHKAYDSDYFHVADEIPISKEFVDYSSEFNNGYQPHTGKFNAFVNQATPKSTVKPSYKELKDIFVTNVYRRLQNKDSQVVSTVKPSYDTTTENVVLITAKKPYLYTNIRDAATPSPFSYSNFASTPSGYLVSTIANLKNQINLGSKPVLSNMYIDKINKYLSFK